MSVMTMAVILVVVTRDSIGEVANDHGYQCLIEELYSAIERFVSGNVLASLPTGLGSRLFMDY